MKYEIIELPETRTAGVSHIGPYTQISDALEKLGAIAGSAGLFARPDVVMLGVYHDDPRTTPAEAAEDELVTEIMIPIQ